MEQKKPQITITNILSFIEGNAKIFLEDIGFQPNHIKEQIAYRKLICDDTCGVRGLCEVCNCDYPDKLYVNKSCNNGTKFPDIMDKKEWNKFKQNNNIDEKTT